MNDVRSTATGSEVGGSSSLFLEWEERRSRLRLHVAGVSYGALGCASLAAGALMAAGLADSFRIPIAASCALFAVGCGVAASRCLRGRSASLAAGLPGAVVMGTLGALLVYMTASRLLHGEPLVNWADMARETPILVLFGLGVVLGRTWKSRSRHRG